MRGLDRAVATRRLAGMLARKGYAPGLAFEVVREALGDALDEDDPFDTD
jgi:regulatory protein